MAKTTAPELVCKIRIGDKDLDHGSGGVYEHRHPYDGVVQAEIPLSGASEVDEAVTAAQLAGESWRCWRPEARRDVLWRLADLIEQNAERFAALGAADTGTPYAMGLAGTLGAVGWFRYYAGWCDKISGETTSSLDTRSELTYTMPEPYGVVALIITWNGPIISLGMKAAAALAAGNCVVIKPAEVTPFVPDLFAVLAREAGIPSGVVSNLPGAGECGEALVKHPGIAKVSFTGGPVTGRRIMAASAEQLKPTVMELGGKSASLVFPDAPDLEIVCQQAVSSTIGILAGQGCSLATRLVVHADIYEQVVDRIVEIASEYTLGDPLDPQVQVGPLINEAAVNRVLGMLDRARADGAATFRLGGGRPAGELAERNFVEPTILADVDPHHEIAQVEIFGPVLVIIKFHDEDEAVRLANATDYGLAAYIQSTDVTRIHRLAERLRAGGVYVNGAYQINSHTPFGGVGISGFGREGGRAGLDEFLHYKAVSIADNQRASILPEYDDRQP
ncbi:aldehyde dehydrogenase family protein [Nocardia pseudovaccinii]|uniref:aldehyde dehydrogenase family protein n=1 Tax=Nocardia pseudovaccinii TaxID=189540 RepID=UPI0007A485C5|nr:aldehyde dehydrogenase family protein [Nocardia pseudovaccinii]